MSDTQLPLWEVFKQGKSGQAHEHVGSVHASDPTMAMQMARDVFARRGPTNSLWVVSSEQIHASNSDENETFFDPGDDKIYRHVKFYSIPEPAKK